MKRLFGVLCVAIGLAIIGFTGYLFVGTVFFAPNGGNELRHLTFLEAVVRVGCDLLFTSVMWAIPFSIGYGLLNFGADLQGSNDDAPKRAAPSFASWLIYFLVGIFLATFTGGLLIFSICALSMLKPSDGMSDGMTIFSTISFFVSAVAFPKVMISMVKGTWYS